MSNSVDSIMNGFNFEKVHKCMILLNWGWAEPGGVPSVVELKAMAMRLLVDAINSKNECSTMACGGFVATKDNDGLGLSFVLEESDNCW
jgi:hypothetical protein